MTKHTKKIMTKSVGDALTANVPNARKSEKNISPHYQTLSASTVFEPQKWTGEIELMKNAGPIQMGSLNPNRVRCPLCRRVNTVELVVQEKVASEYRCTYSGCRDYHFSI